MEVLKSSITIGWLELIARLKSKRLPIWDVLRIPISLSK